MCSAAYEWDKVPADSTICDIGGGNGHAMLGLVQEFPQLKVVLQDLPAVVQQGRDVSQYPTNKRHDVTYETPSRSIGRPSTRALSSRGGSTSYQ